MPTITLWEEFKIYYLWYCCLAPLESTVLTTLIAIRTGALLDFILKQNLEAAWSTAGGVVGDDRFVMFITTYHLPLDTIEIDGQEVEVYLMNDEWWFKWLGFIACPNFTLGCTNCFERQYGR